jgi:cell shape-determining protein MreC
MKDFYRQRKRSQDKIMSPRFIVVLVFLFLLVFIHLAFPNFFTGLARDTLRPLWSNQNASSADIGVFVKSFRSKQSLVRENILLKDELQQNISIQLQNRALREENEALRESLGNRSLDEIILASVLQRPPFTPYDTLLVDIGVEGIVRKGNRVIKDGSVLIGTVSRVDGRTATVTLLSTPGIQTEIFIGTSTASAIAEGLGSGNFIIQVPRELKVKEGEIVFVSDAFSFPLGEVASVEVEPTDPFSTLRIQNSFNFNSLRWVEIVTNDDISLPQKTTGEGNDVPVEEGVEFEI